jgi:hypothetical protein
LLIRSTGAEQRCGANGAIFVFCKRNDVALGDFSKNQEVPSPKTYLTYLPISSPQYSGTVLLLTTRARFSKHYLSISTQQKNAAPRLFN